MSSRRASLHSIYSYDSESAFHASDFSNISMRFPFLRETGGKNVSAIYCLLLLT